MAAAKKNKKRRPAQQAARPRQTASPGRPTAGAPATSGSSAAVPRDERRSWLEGPEIRGTEGAYPGAGLGLPQSGPGSVAGVGRRFASILVDFVIAALIAAALRPVWHSSIASTVVYAVYTWLLTGSTGQTIAMRLFRIRLIGGGGRPPGPLWAAVRVLFYALVFPPFFIDNDRRGLHDRVAGTVCVMA